MLKFLIFFSTIVLVSWGFFIVLSFKKGITLLSFSIKEKIHLLIIILIGIIAGTGIAVTEDREMTFSCSRTTQRCEYYHSTLYDKNMRQANSYDLSDVENATVASYSSRLSNYYKIRFEKENGYFEMPERFDHKKDAERNLLEIRMFLKGKRSDYTYRKPFNPALEYASVFLVGLISLTVLTIASIGMILAHKNKTR